MIDQYIKKHKQDGILFKAEYLFLQAGNDVRERTKAMEEIAYTVSLLNNPLQEEDYVKRIATLTKIGAKLIKDEVSRKKDERKQTEKISSRNDDAFIPEWADEDNWNIHGFDGLIKGKETGFYFAAGMGYARLTNFVLTPIVHIYSDMPDDNVRVTELTNGFDTKVIDMPTKSFLSTLDFEATLGSHGNFKSEGNFAKLHLNKIKGKLWDNYPTCFELQTLGWQDEGFFSFSNIIYHNGFVSFNDYGVATINGVNYISKSASKKKILSRNGSDPYEDDKYLTYKDCPISFKQWCDLMGRTYQMPGHVGAAFALITLFRDVVFKVDNNCPHLYAYGEAQSGKSKYAESVSNLFFNEMPAFNLNQGTDVAFWNRLMRFKNCPVLFNEFDENAIKEEWFRALKSAYDGEGRERGTVKKGKTDKQKVNGTIVLMGQYLSTKDDNSVLSRCIPNAFRKQNERSQEVLKAYDELKALEKNGLSGILPNLLKYRQMVKDRYHVVYGEVKTQMLKKLREASMVGETRIVSNYSHLAAMVKLLSPEVGFGIAYADFFEFCYSEVIKLSHMMSESNALSDFWRTVERLMDTQVIEYGFDLKIESQTNVTKMVNRTTTDIHYFDEPTEVLYLRLAPVHTAYMQLKRSSSGKSGINMQTIEMYMKDQPYYIGTCKSSSFKSIKNKSKTNTSCIMLKYDPMLQATLYREYEIPYHFRP